MSHLEELVQTFCPDGVEYRKLGGICQIATGKLNVNKQSEDGLYPFFTCAKEVYRIDTYAFDTEALLISGNGNVGYIHYYKGKFNAYQRTYVLHNLTQNIFFIKHVLEAGLKKRIEEGLRLGSVPYIKLETLSDFYIPIPPLPVQEEIVRILDTFSSVVAELNAEQAARARQYEHYRDELIIPQGQFEQKTLGDVGRVCMCRRIYKEQTDSSGDVPFYKIGTFGKEPDAFISKELFEEYKSKYSYPKKGDILFSAAGTIGKVVVFDGSPSYFQDSNIVWIDNDESLVLNKYLYYFYSLGNWATSEGGTIARLYNDNISRTPISVPPLEVQEQIVSILDRFDALVNDLKSGLPAEIALRRKQYEYYRDKLLTFPQKPGG